MKSKSLNYYHQYSLTIFLILLFVPSITFSLVPAEIFPWAFLFSLMYLKSFSIKEYFLFFSLIVFSCYSILVYWDVLEVFRSFVAYLNVILIFILFSNMQFSLFIGFLKKFKIFFICLSAFGILQFYGFISFLEPFLQILIPRASADSLSEMGRGITLLSSEPSRAAYEYIFMYSLFRFFFIKTNKVLFDLLMVLYVILLIQSAMGMFMLIFFLAIYYRLKFVLPAFIVSVFFGSMLLGFDAGRAVVVLKNIYSQSSFNELIVYLLNASGFRLVSIYASAISIFDYWLGHGVGSWKESSIIALKLTGLNPGDLSYFVNNGGGHWVSIRPTSPLFAFVLDFGFYSIILFYILFSRVKDVFKFSPEGRNIVFLFFAYFFSMGALGNPIPWIVFGVIISYELTYRRRKCES